MIALLATSPALAALPPDQAAYREIEELCDRYDFPAAAARLEAAERRFAQTRTRWTWGFGIERALVLIGTHKYTEALQILDGEPPHEFARSEPALKGAIWRASVLGKQRVPGAAAAAATAYARAKESYPRLRAEAAITCASIAFTEGNGSATGVRFAREALRYARAQHQQLPIMKSATTLAWALAGQDHYGEAIALNETALPVARSLKLDAFIAKINVNLSWQYAGVGQYERAEEAAAEAYPAAVRAGASYDVVLSLLNRGNSHYLRRNFQEAAQWYRQAYTIARQTNDPTAGSLAGNLAFVALQANDYAAARRYNQEGLVLKHAAHDAAAELYSVLVDARIAMGLGQWPEAEPLLQRVVQKTGSKPLKWEASMRLGQVYAATDRPALADREFRRALDGTDEARGDVAREELRLTFASTVTELYNAYVDFLVTSGRAIDALRVTEQSRARTLTEGLGFDIDRAAAIDPKQIARDKGAVVLAYWLAPERSFLWAITADQVQVFPLPSSTTIAAEVDAYSRELLGPRSTLSERGAKLWRTLVGPAAPFLPRDARVIVIPDDRLNAFNLETLVAGASRPHYWIEDVTIETAASLQLAARGKHERGGGDRLLLIGDPHVPASAEFPPLAHAGAEMDRVRRHFPSTTALAGDAATPHAYETSAGGNYAFVHFVAHGTANLKRPLDSAVILSPDADGYKLYARDIVKHPLSARLVTISSCHGAGTRAYEGEGLVGLAWAFLRAGAHQVIAALWQVSDRATPQLMDRMYAGIRAGRDPASALRDAKLQLMRSSPIYKRPLYWAPFVLYSGS
ncbi:MAG: Tetratricopeptide 1 repeat-containing protein [Acidobacteria bacterium]|nr:Tetratricopeptide 1 repeat-containing protein [Acidobacteriota bacterium]